MFQEVVDELKRIEMETCFNSELLQSLHKGKVCGYKLGLALLNKFCSNQRFVCWGAKILAIQQTNTNEKHKVIKVIKQLIANNQSIVCNQATIITPYLKGHTLGLEAVMLFL